MIGTADIFSWGLEGGLYRVAHSFGHFFLSGYVLDQILRVLDVRHVEIFRK